MQSILYWMNVLAIAIVCVCELAFVIDWLQTRTTAKNPGLFKEVASSAVLGVHPELGRVNAWFAFWITLVALGAWLAPLYVYAPLPPPSEGVARMLVAIPLLMFVWLYELPCIKGNKRAGIWLDRPWR